MKIRMKTFILFLFVCLLLTTFVGISYFAAETEAPDYLSLVPHAAYYGYSSFQEIPQELLHDYSFGINSALFDELLRQNIIPKEGYKVLQHYPSEEELASGVKIPVSVLKNIVDRLYGNGAGDYAIIGQKFSHSNQELHLFPLEKEDSYVFCPAIYQGSYWRQYYSKQLDSKIVGEELIIRSVYAEWTSAEFEDWEQDGTGYKIPVTLYSPENSFSETNYIVLATWMEKKTKSTLDVQIASRIRDSGFDEYLPVYKHTFKPNGDGTYYWAQTELETAGKEIPLSVINPAKEDNTNASTQGSTNTNTTTDTTSDVTTSEVVSDTSTDTATDVSTNTTTDAVTDASTGMVTDVSTGSATDVVPQEEGSSAVWIVVAVVAVAAVAAAAVFFVLKKKKA